MMNFLYKLAYDAHSGQKELKGTADIPETQLLADLMKAKQNPDVNAEKLLEFLRQRAGILISNGVEMYTFPHRMFQEYLASCYLIDLDLFKTVADRLVNS